MITGKSGTETTVTYCSADGHTTVYGYFYTVPEIVPKAVLQISHGMQEYIQRYRPLAWYFAKQGYVVCGNDHLGHGQTSEIAEKMVGFRSDAVTAMFWRICIV